MEDSKLWKLFEAFRRVVVFALGVLCFLKGVISPENTLPELIIGMIMVGVLPLENVFGIIPIVKRLNKGADNDRREVSDG